MKNTRLFMTKKTGVIPLNVMQFTAAAGGTESPFQFVKLYRKKEEEKKLQN